MSEQKTPFERSAEAWTVIRLTAEAVGLGIRLGFKGMLLMIGIAMGVDCAICCANDLFVPGTLTAFLMGFFGGLEGNPAGPINPALLLGTIIVLLALSITLATHCTLKLRRLGTGG